MGAEAVARRRTELQESAEAALEFPRRSSLSREVSSTGFKVVLNSVSDSEARES